MTEREEARDVDLVVVGVAVQPLLGLHRGLVGAGPADQPPGQPENVLGPLRVMRKRRIRHLLVVGPQGQLEGVVSLTDIVLKALEDGSSVLMRELFTTLQDVVQKHGDVRVIEHNPFVED